MHGKVAFWSFLVDMNRLFQKFVTFCLQDLREFNVKPEPVYKWDVKPYTTIKPDIVIRKGREVRLVLDAKYKHISLDKEEVYGTDVRQVWDYCVTLGLQKGILVYPKSSSDQQIYDLQIEKRDPITNRVYQVLLRTIDLTSADLSIFKSVCSNFVEDAKQILYS